MSVINQVLNQLEQRGAHTALERTMVRAVPHSQRRFNMPLLALGVVLVAGGIVAAWQWIQIRKPAVVAASAMQKQQAAVATSAPVHAADTATVASAVIAGETQLAGMIPPAPRPIFELGSIPLPSSRQSFDKAQDGPRSGQAVSKKPLALSAVEGAGQDVSASSGQAALPGSGQALHDAKNSPAPSRVERPAPKEACSEPCQRTEERSANAVPPARPAGLQSMQAGSPKAQAAVRLPADVSPMKQVSPAQHADAEFRKAVALMQQGHIADAIAGYEAVLRLDAGHDAARQALVALLLESKRGADAERVLQDVLQNKPQHVGFAMLLARLQVERGMDDQAAATLERSLPYANSQADYQAFFAALLQRQNRHMEAIAYYQIALQLVPDNSVWLMGYGISLQAMQRINDAKVVFRRALELKTLNPELQAFVQQKLKGL